MAITEVIKYEGDNSTFIWKHPIEDFNTLTQLIVHTSQEAIFFLNGEALDLFGQGRHTLETQNIPLIGKKLNLPTGEETPFHCEVYFINLVEQMAIKWGTDSKVQYMEPTYAFPISIGASGEMSLRVDNSRELLLKLVGTEALLDQSKLTHYFRAILMTRAKTYLATTIREKKISIFEIDEHLDALSEDLKARLYEDFIQYGVSLERFFVTTIVKPDGEANYEQFKSLHFRKYADVTDAKIRQQVSVIDQQAEAQRTVIEAEGIAQKRQIEGYTYQQERGLDVAEKIASNEGSGNMANLGIGMGMMTGIGGGVGNAIGGVFNTALDGMSQDPAVAPMAVAPVAPVPQAAPAAPTPHAAPPAQVQGNGITISKFCENCGTAITPGAAFCDECGVALSSKPTCPSCGFAFEKPGKFCPKCGTKREG